MILSVMLPKVGKASKSVSLSCVVVAAVIALTFANVNMTLRISDLASAFCKTEKNYYIGQRTSLV
jgi:NAD+--asparagine ADP-ribosyltransferase